MDPTNPKNLRRSRWFPLLLILVIILGGVLWAIWRRPREAAVQVYFIKVDPVTHQGTVAPVIRRTRAGEPRFLLRAALEALLAGPTPEEKAEGLSTEIPPGARLRDLEIRDGVVYADFTREVESGGGSFSMQGRLWQIVYTATQLPEGTRVRILIEGEEREVLGGEGLWIGEPLARPPALPSF
ncbi:MAG: GerMN domain-containing protein [Armatimonadota bacterium]|nr:GerMN domain-containing protein [Armatimonadota bacterium]